MADSIPPPAEGIDGLAAPKLQSEPPPLDSIRVKGPGARGLNKPAILGAAGGGVALVLVLASGAFSGGDNRKPAETKPAMSDPARPEMAKGAIRQLPSDYTQVVSPGPLPEPTPPPDLGRPLAGDVAAFARPHPDLRPRTRDDTGAWTNEDRWIEPDAYGSPASPDPREVEEQEAERAGLFFALRDQDASRARGAQLQAPTTPPSQLTAFAPVSAPRDPATAQGTPERSLFPGAIIPASLVTELNSESPGPVIAQITQTIYDSASGRTLLIPQGARLVGDYNSSTRYGQNRVAIAWSRLILPDGREVSLDEAAVDPSGAAGIAGEIDNHWGDVFGAAALGAVINVGVATTENPVATGSGIVIRDPVDTAVSDGVQRTASTVTNRTVDRGLAVPPTIRVPAGAKLSVIVTRRMLL